MLAHGERHTPAIALAPVRHHHLPGLPRIPSQMCTPATVGDLDLPQPAGREVRGARQPPVLSRSARLAEAAGIDQQDTPLWEDAQ